MFSSLADKLDLILSKSRLFIHGTSSKNLQNILSEGTKAEPKKKNWSKDDPNKMPEKESLTGSYWTTSMHYAARYAGEAARKFGGNDLYVFSRMETRDHNVLLDEDDVSNVLMLPVGEKNNELINEFAKGKSSGEELVNAVISEIANKFPNVPKKRWEHSKDVLMRALKSYWGRSHEKMNVRDVKKILSDSLKDLTTENKDFLNVRNIKDVGYSGTHKIVYIAEVIWKYKSNTGEKDTTVEIIDRYGSDKEAHNLIREYFDKRLKIINS